MTIVYFLLGLSLLIFVHELGHFIFAKMFNVYVYEFSMFMGPVLYQKKIGETRYSIRLLPIGGYVAMAGEQNQQAAIYPSAEVLPLDRTIKGIKPWKKFFILAAGATFNLIFAAVLLVGYFMGTGVADSGSAIRVSDDSIFYQAGLQTGDVITSIESNLTSGAAYQDLDVSSFAQVINAINATNPVATDFNAIGQTQCFNIEVLRNNQVQTFNQVCRTFTRYDVNENQVVTNIEPLLGIGQATRSVNIVEASSLAAATTGQMSLLIYNSLGQLFAPGGLENVSGPVGIYNSSVTFADQGFFAFLFFLSLISVNLGVVNLLPFPALDGGQITLLLVETISRKKISPKVEGIINGIGFTILISFIILITIRDIFF
jgi:regulator of sigma E protease